MIRNKRLKRVAAATTGAAVILATAVAIWASVDGPAAAQQVGSYRQDNRVEPCGLVHPYHVAQNPAYYVAQNPGQAATPPPPARPELKAFPCRRGEAAGIGARLKEQFGRQLTFCGGLGTQDLLVRATPEQVREEVRRLKREMGRGGGYILEPGITVQADVPLPNMLALIDAARA